MIAEDGNNVLLVLGAPRSGTTWLAKIFDSHPDVVYRHEPDKLLGHRGFAVVYPGDPVSGNPEGARSYVRSLLSLHDVQTAGSAPQFRKSYRPAWLEYGRWALIHGLRYGSAAPGARWMSRVAVPDAVRHRDGRPITYVMKSVNALTRILLFNEVLPRCRMVFVIRDPCGHVASVLHGLKVGMFDRDVTFSEIFETREASNAGLDPETFAKLDLLEQCAWHWALFNQKAVNDLENVAHAKIVRYAGLCNHPFGVAEELFAFAGFKMHRQTATFLTRSTVAGGTGRYYDVFRDSRTSAERWRNVLSEDEQRRIWAIARRFPVSKRFAP